MLLMGKSTISMAIFHVAFCMFTRPGNTEIQQHTNTTNTPTRLPSNHVNTSLSDLPQFTPFGVEVLTDPRGNGAVTVEYAVKIVWGWNMPLQVQLQK